MSIDSGLGDAWDISQSCVALLHCVWDSTRDPNTIRKQLKCLWKQCLATNHQACHKEIDGNMAYRKEYILNYICIYIVKFERFSSQRFTNLLLTDLELLLLGNPWSGGSGGSWVADTARDS